MKLDDHIGKAVAGLIAAGMVAVPTLTTQVGALKEEQDRLRTEVGELDDQFDTAAIVLGQLTDRVLNSVTAANISPRGGGYDRKSDLESMLDRLDPRTPPPEPPKGDDDDSAATPGDDDDSAGKRQ